MLLALTHEQIDERTEIATPNRTCYMTKVCSFLAPEKESQCQKCSQDVSECQASTEIGFGARSGTCHPITCSAEPLLRSGVCL